MTIRLSGLLLALGLVQACAPNYALKLKEMKKLDAVSYSKIREGEPHDFTALAIHVLDRDGTTEVSRVDDPRLQAQIADLGDTLLYSDNTADLLVELSSDPLPSKLQGDWDKLFLRHEAIHGAAPGPLYVSVSGPEDVMATISEVGSTLVFNDLSKEPELFPRQPGPPDTDPVVDAVFTSADTGSVIERSSRAGAYQLKGPRAGKTSEFRPMMYGLWSSQRGVYQGVIYDGEARQWFVFDLVPTDRLICLDLARAYETASGSATYPRSIAASKALIKALSGQGRTSLMSAAESTYEGFYAPGNVAGQSGYATVYDYGYLPAEQRNILARVFKGAASAERIKEAMRRLRCGLDL